MPLPQLQLTAYGAEIAAAGRSFPAVPPALVRAVIATESRFDPKALRGEPQLKDASRGLMQLTMTTARGLGYYGTADNLFVPAVNIYYGTKLLAQLYSQLGRWDGVISAYNGGIRPQYGFGVAATRLLRGVCLEHDPLTGRCRRAVDVAPGRFANQEYVDRVRRWWQYYGGGAVKGGAGLALGLAVGAVALSSTRKRKGR